MKLVHLTRRITHLSNGQSLQVACVWAADPLRDSCKALGAHAVHSVGLVLRPSYGQRVDLVVFIASRKLVEEWN